MSNHFVLNICISCHIQNCNFSMNPIDILQPISHDKLPELRDKFTINWPAHLNVYYLLDTFIKWKLHRPTETYATVYCKDGHFDNGTFIAIIEMYCYDVFLYTLDESMRELDECLRKTNRIVWEKNPLFAAVREDFYETVVNAREAIGHPVSADNPSNVWWLPKETALCYDYSIPNELYLAPLNTSHAEVLNSEWPHKYKDSDKYLAKVIELNGGVGLFAKSNNELCSWVLKNYFGGLGVLQTATEHRRKGYGTLITKIFTKQLAEEGYDVTAFIVRKNSASQKMFHGLSFENIVPVTWCYYK